MISSSFRFPTAIAFGMGVSKTLGSHLKNKFIKKPLIVTDAGMVKLSVFQELVTMLEGEGWEFAIYSEAAGNPVEEHVTAGVKAFRQSSCDGIVMVGGGCALDVGKAIALMVHHPGNLFDYEDDMPGARPIDQPLPPMIAIPTTAGTGSEVGGSSVISRSNTHQKVIIWSSRLIPHQVLADPGLTVALPSFVTAATGIDALTHNVEAFLAKNYHPICDGIALEGVRLIAKSLSIAFQQPENLEARSNMLMASMMGAIAFQKGLGVTHSCAHALSTCYDLHHGYANGVMFAACMEFNARSCSHKFLRLCQAVGIESSLDLAAKNFCQWIDQLRDSIGIPSHLKLTITDHLLETAFKDSCHLNNPIPCTKEDFKQIFSKVLS